MNESGRGMNLVWEWAQPGNPGNGNEAVLPTVLIHMIVSMLIQKHAASNTGNWDLTRLVGKISQYLLVSLL